MDFWLWCKSKQPLPDTVDFEVSETAQGISFKIRSETVEAIAAAAASVHNLQLTDETTGGDAIVGVRWGQIGGMVADSTMGVSNSPMFTVTLTSTGVWKIWAELTGAYDTATSKWELSTTAADFTVVGFAVGSPPSNTSTLAYVEIGQAERVSDGSGGYKIKAGSIGQEVTGSQGFVRNYYSTSAYNQHNWKL